MDIQATCMRMASPQCEFDGGPSGGSSLCTPGKICILKIVRLSKDIKFSPSCNPDTRTYAPSDVSPWPRNEWPRRPEAASQAQRRGPSNNDDDDDDSEDGDDDYGDDEDDDDDDAAAFQALR